MTEQEKRCAAFRQAVNALPLRLQAEALGLPREVQSTCEELRLRAGQGMHYSTIGREIQISSSAITVEELQEVLNRATRYSVHSFAESLAQGFVTLEGGHRLGLCGTAIVKDGELTGVRGLSSVNLRIASQTIGVADAVAPCLRNGRRVWSTLILSPPAWGKTTLLRDLIRTFSYDGIRIGVADERCEVSGTSGGVPQFDLGPTADVMSGGAKADAALLLLKTMSPEVLALDEITSPRDVEAVLYAAHCGAAILATAHAGSLADLQRRPLYRRLQENHIFERLVCIELIDGVRHYRMTTMEGETLC